MTNKEKKNDFLATPDDPLPYVLRNGEFGIVTGMDDTGRFVGFIIPSELKSAWDLLGSDADGDKAFDLMELVRPGSVAAGRFKTEFKATINRLSHPKPPETKSQS